MSYKYGERFEYDEMRADRNISKVLCGKVRRKNPIINKTIFKKLKLI